MLEYSYSYETYRTCLQQYLDSLGGRGCGADPVTTDSRLTKTDQGPVLLSRRVARRNFLRHDGVCATSQLNASY